MSTITPAKNRILVSEVKQSTTTASGILVEGSLGDSKLFEIRAVGSEVRGFREGERVVIDLPGSVPTTVDGKQYLLVKDEQIVAVVG